MSAALPARTLPDPFSLPVRVYYEDTDAGGVVYYANYLKFMERARTEWLGALGFALPAFGRDWGIVFAVHRAEIDFLLPARLGDQLEVTVAPAGRGACRLELGQQVLRDGTVLAKAQIDLACLDAKRFRPVRFPAPLAESLAGLPGPPQRASGLRTSPQVPH